MKLTEYSVYEFLTNEFDELLNAIEQLDLSDRTKMRLCDLTRKDLGLVLKKISETDTQEGAEHE